MTALGGDTRSVEPAWVLVGITFSLLICGSLLLYGSGRGFDLTDETFYIIWTRDPNAYQFSYQPFGYLLHPLFELVGGDLQAYRLMGFAITAAAGALVGHSLRSASRRAALFTIYGASAALTIFFPWIVTPSYNSAANVAALLIIGGVLSAFAHSVPTRILGLVATGFGLCVAAFSKPPLFALAAVGIAVTALFARGRRAELIGSLALGGSSMCLFLSPSEIVLLVRRIIVTQHVLALPNTPPALPGKILRDWLAVPVPITAAVIAGALGFAVRRTRWYAWPGYAAIALSLYYIASIVPDAIDGEIPDFLGVAIITMVAAYAAVLQREQQSSLSVVALLLVAPVAVALGTFNNQWSQLNFSMAFPFIALLTLASADPIASRKGAAQCVAIVGPMMVMLLAAWSPYSLPASIFDQQIPIKPPLASGSVRVDQETADFVRSARGLGQDAVILDLSGTGPGVDVVLGGRSPVVSWLNPAVPAWVDLVWSRLSVEQRRSAWFVVPVWPQFAHSAPARWLKEHRGQYCNIALPEMPFWGEERVLQVWRPCELRDSRVGADTTRRFRIE
jgi:hypothetical protein